MDSITIYLNDCIDEESALAIVRDNIDVTYSICHHHELECHTDTIICRHAQLSIRSAIVHHLVTQ